MKTIKKSNIFYKYIYLTSTLIALFVFALTAGGYLAISSKTVTVEYDGTSETVKLYGDATVADVFKNLEIELSAFDRVTPNMDAQIADGDIIVIERDILSSGTSFAQHIVAKSFTELEVVNDMMRTEAEEKQKTESYTYSGKQETTANITESIIEVGGNVYSYTEVISVTATAYCPCSTCCGSYANGITADGSVATAGYTIAAPPEFAFGTKFYLPYFDRVFEVQDRGGAIQDMRIDIYFDSHEEALRFGIKTLDVYILK